MTPANIVNPKCKSVAKIICNKTVAKIKSLTTLNIALKKPPSIETANTNKICTKIENFDIPTCSNHRKNTLNQGNFGILGNFLCLPCSLCVCGCCMPVSCYKLCMLCYLKKTRLQVFLPFFGPCPLGSDFQPVLKNC